MQEQDALKSKNKKLIRGVSASIITVGIITGTFLLTPKISALIEYNSLVSKVNEIPANSQLKSLEARKDTIQEIKSLIEQLKITNEKLGREDNNNIVIAENQLELLSQLVKEDEKIQIVFEALPSNGT